MFESRTTIDIARAPSSSASAPASAAERVEAIVSKLRVADALTAEAICLLGRGGIEAATGLSAEMLLMISTRRTFGEARTLMGAADTLRQMPHLSKAFSEGTVSWGQVRAIAMAVTRVRVADRAEIDSLIAERARAMVQGDPDALVEFVDSEVERRRSDLALTHEDRAIKAGFLTIQGHLDGGGTIYGEGDAASIATIAEALDVVADAPCHPEDGPSRPQQWFGALVAMCETTLGGAGQDPLVARPRPRLIATFDLAAWTDKAGDDTMVLLAALTGRSPRLTSVARDTMLCDSTIVPVLFDGAHPVAVGDASNTFSDKVRTAVIARDRRCRFCGRAPAAWCDAHDLVPGVGNTANDGCLLCRVYHRRVHRYGWQLTLREDGAIEFKRRGKSFLSLPP